MRLTMKPGVGVERTVVLPQAVARSATASTTAAEVAGPATISTRRIRGTGLKKCSPTTRSGYASPTASAAGDSDGGLVARSEEHTSELQSQSNLVCRLL